MENKIDIVIPIFNSEKYIYKCLESIKNQSIKNFKIIIVNDGSTDNSENIIFNFINNNSLDIDYYKTLNLGVSNARNVGIENSKNKYVMFLDSDDFLPNNAIEILINEIQLGNNDIVCGAWTLLNQNGKKMSRIHNDSEELNGDDFLLKCLNDKQVSHSSCSKLYRRDFIGDLRFEYGRKCNEDSFFIFQCAIKKPKVKIIDVTTYFCVKNMKSSSNADFSEKFFDILYFAKKKNEIITSEFPEYSFYKNDILTRAYINLLINLSKTSNKKYKEITEQSIKFIKNNSKKYEPKNKTEKIVIYIVKHNLFYFFRFFCLVKFKMDKYWM